MKKYMKKYIAIFEVPDDCKPADFIDVADGWFTDEEGNLFTVGTKLEEAKQGEWIDQSYDYGYVECPFCHKATNCVDNIDELHYCWNCGAKLEKGGAE